MKHLRTIILATFLLMAHFASAQIIPNSAKESLDKKYPEAKQVRWSILENKSGFQVNFLDRKKHKHAIFSREFKWVQTTTIVNTKRDLPGLVRLAIDESYPQSAYDWMEWVESPEESYFVIGVTSETEEKEEMILRVTKEGQILSASKDNKSHL